MRLFDPSDAAQLLKIINEYLIKMYIILVRSFSKCYSMKIMVIL